MAAPERDADADESGSTWASRRERKEDAAACGDLAYDLVNGKPAALPDPPFDEALRQAIADARPMAKGARQRQIRRIAGLLQQAAPLEELRDALEGRAPQVRAEKARERANEAWRARLLTEGDNALSEFLVAFPDADRRQLRQLVRRANKTPPDLRSRRSATNLLREVRALNHPIEDASDS